MKFEDTELLDHPTVRKAYEVMRGFFSNGDDFARQAIMGGELISRHAKNPDPDAIAASVLQGGMIIPYKAESFTESVSLGAADILKMFRKVSLTKPTFNTDGERQFMLALNYHALIGLESKIVERDIFKYKEIKKMVDLNARTLEAAAAGMTDQSMANLSREKLHLAQAALEDLRSETIEKMKFENAGLPNHPTVKKAYAQIRADEKKHDIFFTNRTEMGASIARVLFDTGASTDPDVLGAAILNQHFDLEDKKGGFPKMAAKFSARLIEIYRDTSPMASNDLGEKPAVVTPEMAMISAATYVYILESAQQRYLDKKKQNDGDFKDYTGPLLLEDIETHAKTLANLAEAMPHAGLKLRMEKAIAAADQLLNAPANVKIRKPGSPSIDRGW